MEEAAISFDHVSKRYGEAPVLEELCLDVPKGTFLTLIGRSGCGKTTALKLVNGLLSPDGGTVRVHGEDVATADQIALRRRIGYVIQGVGLFPHMTVAKNIAYVPSLSKLWDRETEARRVGALLETVGLDRDMAARYPGELSGGQRQRVGIARALAAEPDILLMDEPFGAVDEITRRALQDEMRKLQRRLGVTVVFVTHDIKEALKLGDLVLVMDAGRVVQQGRPEEIRHAPATEFVRALVSDEG